MERGTERDRQRHGTERQRQRLEREEEGGVERNGAGQTNERVTSPKGWIQTSNKVASPFKGPRILHWGNYMSIVAWIGDRQTSFFLSFLLA